MTRRYTTPEIRAGDWVQVTKVVQVRGIPVSIPILPGVDAEPGVLTRAGYTVQVFHHEPGPTELKAETAVIRRAVDAELAKAEAETLLTVAEDRIARERVEQRRASDRDARRLRDYRTSADVERARVRLLSALLEYAHTWAGEFREPPPVPLHELYTKSLVTPCPTYEGDAGEGDEEPTGRGAPCVRMHLHEGAHTTVEGRRFDAPSLFEYVDPYRKD